MAVDKNEAEENGSVPNDVEPRDKSRRAALGKLAATTTAAWAAPEVLATERVAAAVGSAAELEVTGDAVIGTLLSGQSLRPESVTYSSNTNFFVFEEKTDVLLAGQATDSGLALPIGVSITSYLIHYSPASGNATLSGTVSFPGVIVGWDWQDATLVAGDPRWAVDGVNYGTTRRRMEFPGNDDFAVDAANCFVDLVSLFAASQFNDQLRVYILS